MLLLNANSHIFYRDGVTENSICPLKSRILHKLDPLQNLHSRPAKPPEKNISPYPERFLR